MKIYVVQGNCGEYSDYREWMVKAFSTEDKAIEWAEKCKRRASELEVLRREDGGSIAYRHKLESEFDPNIQSDYTGTDYTITSVEYEPNR